MTASQAVTATNTTTTTAENEERKETTSSSSSMSLGERYQEAIDLVEASPVEAVATLEVMQQEVARLALFSSNETLDDISTKSIPLLSLEHYLALALTRIPTPSSQITKRPTNLRKSIDLWIAFIQKLETLQQQGGGNGSDNNNNNIITPEEQKEYQILLECSSNNNNNDSNSSVPQLPTPRREDKIARFKAKQQAKKEVERLGALKERRKRIGVASEEIMDELDEETLDRNLAMTNLLINKAEALEEWASTLRELPMIERMVQQVEEQQSQMDHKQSHTNKQQQQQQQRHLNSGRTPPAPANGLQVTHITLDASNQLQFRKEEIKSQVFRPGWNQPTMSLEEFANRERADALQREQKQEDAEASAANRPRRYEQLVRDGQEDDIEAVDASAAMDRAWDDWKDENPRGSGNKRGDQGDRNF